MYYKQPGGARPKHTPQLVLVTLLHLLTCNSNCVRDIIRTNLCDVDCNGIQLTTFPLTNALITFISKS